jgi:hypothetical protein
MCTVTYVPAAAAEPGGFTLTHNRDEAPSRSPHDIFRAKTPSGDTLIFPRDTRAGGAWIVASRSGRTACLLNGAFVKHDHRPPYRRSRGLLLLDFFDWENSNDFFRDYDLEGIEPFTLLFFEKNRAVEFRWDGHARHLKNLPPDVTHFWCSATLYPAEMQARREQVFRQWFLSKKNTPTQQQLLSLHRTGSVGDPENDFVMNRGGRVCTVSITQVTVKNSGAVMRYHDLLGNRRAVKRLRFLSADANEKSTSRLIVG